MDDVGLAAAPLPGDSIADHGSLREKIAHLAQQYCKDEAIPLPELKKKLMTLVKMIDSGDVGAEGNGDGGEVTEDLTDPLGLQKKAGGATGAAAGGLVGAGTGAAIGRNLGGTPGALIGAGIGGGLGAMGGKKVGSYLASDETVNTVLQQLRDSGDPRNKELAESLGKKITESAQAEQKLMEELDALRVKDAHAAKQTKVVELCDKAYLEPRDMPEGFKSQAFLNQLMGCSTEQSMKDLIEDRKAIFGLQKPRSSPSHYQTKPGTEDGKKEMKAEEFASQVRTGVSRN